MKTPKTIAVAGLLILAVFGASCGTVTGAAVRGGGGRDLRHYQVTEAAMKNRMCLIVSLAGGLMVSGGAALGQDPAADKTRTPERVEGQVTQLDVNQGKLTLRASDGTVHVFEASKERRWRATRPATPSRPG